jgi:hypothetical protein
MQQVIGAYRIAGAKAVQLASMSYLLVLCFDCSQLLSHSEEMLLHPCSISAA